MEALYNTVLKTIPPVWMFFIATNFPLQGSPWLNDSINHSPRCFQTWYRDTQSWFGQAIKRLVSDPDFCAFSQVFANVLLSCFVLSCHRFVDCLSLFCVFFSFFFVCCFECCSLFCSSLFVFVFKWFNKYCKLYKTQIVFFLAVDLNKDERVKGHCYCFDDLRYCCRRSHSNKQLDASKRLELLGFIWWMGERGYRNLHLTFKASLVVVVVLLLLSSSSSLLLSSLLFLLLLSLLLLCCCVVVWHGLWFCF